MGRVNKTKNNLQNTWSKLDDACGFLEESFYEISNMNMPEEIVNSMERIDISQIVHLKNLIEELIEKKN